jgi:hypothetical protein
MGSLSKRATVYFDPEIHKALKIMAAETTRSISDIVDDALRRELAEDEEDLRSFEERASERTMSFDKVLKDLKANGKI